ncbi:ABC transporter substrate-binding protein [Streptomyces sp. ME02-6979A]|uniref:ABC transporter substrate-binding protein n=1 Tax=Streptomyces sp. ME02-6979A TaxID=3028674 RepID=UPI0029B040C5|nr:ABC transporter substrate-binding protein [Streptomyces sp. ME02-6979A]MDX3348685.1 ABC transporter substrate-binding protein [Streptomyces sp. ME02-6979A]
MNRKDTAALCVSVLAVTMATGCGILGGDENRVTLGSTDQLEYSADAPAPLDPAAAYDLGAWNIMHNVFQTLLRPPLMAGGKPSPEAAEQCYFTDEEETEFSCTLRKGLQFSDGEPVTSEDVKYSIERVLRIKYAGGPFGLLENVSRVEARDDRKIVFHLKRPDATFPYKLSTPVASIVSDKYYPSSKVRKGFEVDGTGPYTMKVHSKGKRGELITFDKNNKYKGSLEVKNTGIDLKIFKSAEDMSRALKKSEIDVITRGFTSAQVRELQWEEDDTVNFYKLPSLETRYLVFNSKNPDVAKKSVRQAMAQLIDRSSIVQKVYPDTGKELHSIIPAHMFGHVNSFSNKYGEPSVEKARKLLAADGVKTPVRLTLNYTTDHYGPATKQEFKEIERQLDTSGLFEVDVRGTEWSRFGTERLEKDYPVYGMGWFPDYSDADGFLAPFLGRRNDFGTEPSPRVRDVLLPREQRQSNRARAVEDLEAIQDSVAEDVWFVPLWQGVQFVAAQNYVTGVEQAVNSSSELQLWELRRGLPSE